MIRYHITCNQPHRHFIDISVQMDTRSASELVINLPAWRPGRYELANYAQNIQYFKVENADGQVLKTTKVSRNSWVVETGGANEIRVKYNYYACQLDAGGSYFDESQLYINPVNCLVYMEDRISESCSVQIHNLPDEYKLVCGVPFDKDRVAEFVSFHELFDSPFMAASGLHYNSYTIGSNKFNIWMLGNVYPDWERIITDFSSFTQKQVELFGEIPVSEYHFLFQNPDSKVYHGVEHQSSTVIALGPGYKLMQDDMYTEFLGISSHELFHTWNVKFIRPADMLPYDYSRENYSRMNYVTEGVTTYYGDFMLLRSGSYSWSLFAAEMEKSFEKHFHNYGRFYQSLVESSMDAWVDGYKPGIPDRKISFYTKGMMVAWLLDLSLRRDTNNTYGLDEVMKRMYYQIAKQGQGYTEESYLRIINEVSGNDYLNFFGQYVWGVVPLENALQEVFEDIGCKLLFPESESYSENRLGFRIQESSNGRSTVNHVVPGGPADAAGLSINDEIIAVNNHISEKNADELMRLEEGNEILLSVMRNKQVQTICIQVDENRYYRKCKIVKSREATAAQKENFKLWSHQEF